ncbi:hypothetical protein [Halopiger thermotolerans]
MTKRNPAGRPNDRQDGKSIDSESGYAAGALERAADLEAEDVVVQRLRIAQEFDDAEAREQRPRPFYAYYATNGEYAVEGTRKSGEWIVADSTDVVSTEGWR